MAMIFDRRSASDRASNYRVSIDLQNRILQMDWNYAASFLSKISHFLERILMEHIDKKNSLDSKQQVCRIYFIEIRSRN